MVVRISLPDGGRARYNFTEPLPVGGATPSTHWRDIMLRTVSLLVCALMMVVPGSARAVEVGDTVLAFYEAANAYFIGTAVEKTDDGFRIVFEDGDTAVVPAGKIRKNDIKVGTAVIAKFKDGKYYPGKVGKVVGRAFYIHYDDGDKGWAPWSWISVK
jgi:hypothetical protein